MENRIFDVILKSEFDLEWYGNTKTIDLTIPSRIWCGLWGAEKGFQTVTRSAQSHAVPTFIRWGIRIRIEDHHQEFISQWVKVSRSGRVSTACRILIEWIVMIWGMSGRFGKIYKNLIRHLINSMIYSLRTVCHCNMLATHFLAHIYVVMFNVNCYWPTSIARFALKLIDFVHWCELN